MEREKDLPLRQLTVLRWQGMINQVGIGNGIGITVITKLIVLGRGKTVTVPGNKFVARPREREDERFWRYAMPEPNSGCWLWIGSINRDGYAHFIVKENEAGVKFQRGARWSYSRFVGPIPEGKVIDHKCRVRCCVNPSHLECVSVWENTFRGEGPSAKNKRKVFCIRGHELGGNNIYVNENGGRTCKICLKMHTEEYRAAARARKLPKVEPLFCKNGHLWSENTKFNHERKRVCITCDKINKHKYKLKMRNKCLLIS